MTEMTTIPETGFMRSETDFDLCSGFQEPIMELVAKDLFPKPIKLSERTTVWRCEDIREYIQKFAQN